MSADYKRTMRSIANLSMLLSELTDRDGNPNLTAGLYIGQCNTNADLDMHFPASVRLIPIHADELTEVIEDLTFLIESGIAFSGVEVETAMIGSDKY